MGNQDDSKEQTLTTLGVAVPDKLAGMSTRSLSAAQSARVRARLKELLAGDENEKVSQLELERRLRISQQVISRIVNGGPAGFYVAQKLAAYDGIPVESYLDGTPGTLEKVIRSGRGKWSPPTIAAVRKSALDAKTATYASWTEEQWTVLLDRVERVLSLVLREGTRKER